jgi:hypothetical protein
VISVTCECCPVKQVWRTLIMVGISIFLDQPEITNNIKITGIRRVVSYPQAVNFSGGNSTSE